MKRICHKIVGNSVGLLFLDHAAGCGKKRFITEKYNFKVVNKDPWKRFTASRINCAHSMYS